MWLNKLGSSAFAILILLVLAYPVRAQLSMDIEINENLSNSQSINIQSLLANNGKGPTLFRMYLQNNSADFADDLFFRLLVESDKIGRILEIRQLPGQPFSLDPGQQVFATNNNIGDGLPGVEELIQFDGKLTVEGREFVNELKGSTSLPADRYRIRIEIHKRSANGQLLASETAEIGRNIIEDTHDFYLLSPGNVVGSDAAIANSYPSFQWQGTTGTDYRLVVVEGKDNESPQSLIEGALSTSPIQVNRASNGGSLVDYEMLDVVVSQSNFQYPNTGVQNLQSGKTYYWKIISQLQSSSGVQQRESEIWSFTLAFSQQRAQSEKQSAEYSKILQQILGNQLEQYKQDGYQFHSILKNGDIFKGGQGLQKLMELHRKAEQGDISIVIEEQ